MANGLFTSKKVLNIEFSRRSSCDLLKSNFSIARPISEASKCEAPNFFLNSANLITRTNSTGCGVQENEFWSFEVYCITLSAHFVKKNTLKSNIKRISKAQSYHKGRVGGWEERNHRDTFFSITTQIPHQALT